LFVLPSGFMNQFYRIFQRQDADLLSISTQKKAAAAMQQPPDFKLNFIS